MFSLDKPVVAVVHKNLISKYRHKGDVFVVNRDNFENVRQAIRDKL